MREYLPKDEQLILSALHLQPAQRVFHIWLRQVKERSCRQYLQKLRWVRKGLALEPQHYNHLMRVRHNRDRTLVVRMLATNACCAADTFRSSVSVRCCTRCLLSAVNVRAAIDGRRTW
eukprot:6202377-Pleurochrysis_carterae.AAC.4